jgi:2-methylfumaryl-CoA isomerase
MTQTLEGLRVIEASAFVAAPYAGLLLGQMGADVIRIDPVGGGLDYRRWPVTESGRSLYWAGLNKGKRSIMINVRTAEGREIAQSLMTLPGEDAGLVITNLAARGWLDYESLCLLREDLIMVNVVGNRDGSVAVDYTVNAATGFPFVTGPADFEGPINHVMPVWDVVAAYSIVQALLGAERFRRKTGKGQFAQFALSDTAFAALSHLGYIAEAQINHIERPRTGNDVYGSYGRDFETADGKRVMITAVTVRHWNAILEATGTAAAMQALEASQGIDLRNEEARYAARTAIAAILEPWFRQHSLEKVRAALDSAGACWGPYQRITEAIDEDARVSTRNPTFDEIDQPGVGKHLAAGSIIDSSATPRARVQPAPVLGQDTDAVLSELLGITAARIGELHDAGVVAGPLK